MTRLVTPTLIVRVTPFIHRSKPLLTTLSPSQTLSFAQFSSETASCAPNASVAFHHRPAKLPEDLSKNVVVLSCESTAKGGMCNVYVVGTHHGSKESYRRVQAIVSFLKPQVVFLELCDGRPEMLTHGHEISEPLTLGCVYRRLKNKDNVFDVLLDWFYDKVDRKEETNCEFRVAYEEAIKYGGKVVLGYRPSEITLKRAWSKMPLWEKAKGICFLSLYPVIVPTFLLRKEVNDDESDYEDSSNDDSNIEAFNEVVLHERDQYMSAKLLKVASVSSSVVAVVGKGHLHGVKRLWKQPVVVEDLLSVPSPKPAISAKRIFTSVRVAAAGVVIISGVYLSCKWCL